MPCLFLVMMTEFINDFPSYGVPDASANGLLEKGLQRQPGKKPPPYWYMPSPKCIA
jgi:hypothetical protein